MRQGQPSDSTALAPVNHRALARPDADFLRSAIAGQLSPQTRRAYAADVAQFLNWLTGQALAPQDWQARPDSLDVLRQVKRADVIAFRAWLAGRDGEGKGYAPLTVNRKLATIRSLLAEAVAQGVIPSSPAAGVRGFKANSDYQATPALSRSQARALLESPDTSTLTGLRDRALLHLALRTGLRVAELAGLRVGDLGEEQGYSILTIRGKGNRTRRAKVAVDVARELRAWLQASGRAELPEVPVFVALRKSRSLAAPAGSEPEKHLTTVALWGIVKRHLARVVGDRAARFGPHSLRATFITLALKGGAALHKVQQAAGHADPRTTLRYNRQAEDLDDNAADYVRLNGED